ncbi:MMPL family transporter [Pseudonocardia aurantiaca]|uniref:MMPL family transporter n=1 Tax=Pseudonocardia aurantiaca TaxID=75290 RepID=A0ABW4FMV8_9PSEU
MFSLLTRLLGRPRLVLVVTLVAAAGLIVLGGGGARLLNGGTTDPGSESARAAAVLDQTFPESRPNVVLVVRPQGGAGIDDPAVAAAGRAIAEHLASEPGVVGVESYWDAEAPELRGDADLDQPAGLVLARVPGEETAADAVYLRAVPAAIAAGGDAVTVEGTGPIAVRLEMQTTISQDLVGAEMVVLPVVLLVLVLAFGSAVAALLPLAVGMIAIVGTSTVLALLSQITQVSIFSQNLTTALGLGLAIDYAIIVVRRFREELHAGATPRAAASTTITTAGRTVAFSAITVAVALAVMLFFPLYFLQSFAYAGIAVVVFAAVSVLIVVPAALVLLGRRVDALDLRKLVRRRRGTAALAEKPVQESRWYRFAWAVMRRPRLVTAASVAVLVLFAVPFLGVQFGAPDERQLRPGAPARVATEALQAEFGDVPDWVVDVVAEGYRHDPAAAEAAGGVNVLGEAVGDAASSDDPAIAAMAAYAKRLSEVDGVYGVLTPVGPFQYGWQVAGPIEGDDERVSGDVTYLQVMPETGIDQASARAQQIVRDVRAVEAPFAVTVGGGAAEQVDSQAAIGDRLPLAVGIILVVTLLLVFLLTGSVVLPVQTVVLNALSLTVMFGAAVWIFQDGALSGLLGFTPLGFLELSLPVLMFCLAFGLSMDYGVFVLSRVKEERDSGREHREAIAVGMARTGGLITAAAVILSIVLFAMGAARVTNIQLLGIGVGLAVLVDATLVRCLLVPAVLAWTGPATWWAPGPLRRFHQRFGLHEEGPPPGDRPGEDPATAPREPVAAR